MEWSDGGLCPFFSKRMSWWKGSNGFRGDDWPRCGVEPVIEGGSQTDPFSFSVCVCVFMSISLSLLFQSAFGVLFPFLFFSRGLLVSVSEASIWSTDKSRPEQLMTGAVSALDMEEKKWRTPRTSYFVPPSISLDLILRMCILGHRRDTRCVLEWTR